MEMQQFSYNNKVVRDFLFAGLIFGAVGMLVGLLVALQLIFPSLSFDLSILGYGRIRALHTNAVIFAFVGNTMFAGVYYSLQRLLKTRLASDFLTKFHFWGWQFIIVAAVITLPLGYTSSKEYAELEWPIDIAIALVWVAFGVNMFWTIMRRRERHLYVAIWFYIATFVTVAVLHIVNNIELPIHFMKSYSAYSGVKDALVQWWYGHNAVAFFLTTPILGLMYYFLPKAANRPIYSYKLSIIHFWALIFIYIWAGPHHLLYTALPDWAQSLGVVFSVMLIFPSWGGMLNGLLTLRGAWDKVRDSAVLKFFVVAVTAYGMATFEGPMLSLKSVNAIAHYTDWIPAHVHIGTLGWNGFMIFAMSYWLIPRMYRTKLYSEKWANTHFWIGTLGIVFWTLPMYVSGFTQSLMWKQFSPDGTLVYGNFLETVTQLMPMFALRAFGGALYLVGMVYLFVNLYKTVRGGSFEAEEPAEAPALPPTYTKHKGEHWHRWIERRPTQLMIGSIIVILIGGIVEIVPTMMVDSNIPKIESVKPYTPLELEGRDIYIREGCNACHTQMIRPFRSETVRYGEYSKAGEFVYDFPFLWGSKRTGPDLHRVGGKYPHSWHYKHMYDPTRTSDGSIMPAYTWLFNHDGRVNELNTKYTQKKMKTLQKLGVPYTDEEVDGAIMLLESQARAIAEELNKDDDIEVNFREEIISMIAYLQRLGTDIKVKQEIAKTE